VRRIRIAILCRHNLSSIEPGEKVHVHSKIMALAKQSPVTLFTPHGHASRDMQSQMRIIQVSPPGLRFALALVLTLFAHRMEYDCIYSRDLLLVVLAMPMKVLGKSLVIELNGIPSLEAEIQRQAQRVRQPKLTPLICGLIRLVEAFAIQCADLVLPVTTKMKNSIVRDYRTDIKRVVVVPNAVDTTVFRPLEEDGVEIRRKLGIDKETVVLLVSSFSAKWRGLAQLLRVADAIQRKREDIVFLVVGSGPLLQEMKTERPRCEALNRVLFTGAVDQCLVPVYISAADVYVHDMTPAAGRLIEKEGLCPTKILESMSCGKPVIAPKETELENMLRKSSGGFCAASTEQLEALIEMFADSPNLAKSMGRNARRYVQLNHDLNRLTMLKIALISKVVSSKRDRRAIFGKLAESATVLSSNMWMACSHVRL